MLKNKLILLGMSALFCFGLNELVNKNVRANVDQSNAIVSQNNYRSKINQLTEAPQVQQNNELKNTSVYSAQSSRSFKSNINSRANKIQNHIVNSGIRANSNEVKNRNVEPINNDNQYRYNAVHAHRRNNRSRYFKVDGAKHMKFTGQGTTDACELASVKNILSIHHKATRISLRNMINRIGWNKNWNRGYTGNPYTKHGVTISPGLEARLLRYYGVRAHVHNYMNKRGLIRDLKHGMQFVIEAGHRCYSYHANHTITDHILAITGIKHDRHGLWVQYVEPNAHRHPVAWCPFSRLWRSYNRPRVTGNRLVVAGY